MTHTTPELAAVHAATTEAGAWKRLSDCLLRAVKPERRT